MLSAQTFSADEGVIVGGNGLRSSILPIKPTKRRRGVVLPIQA